MRKRGVGTKPGSWLQGARTHEMPEWIVSNPAAFRLLYEFAERSRRGEADIEYEGQLIHLDIRQFITGRKSTSEKIGITEQVYRNLYKRFLRLDYIRTIQVTNKYTIGEYLANGIFFNNYPTDEPTEKPSIRPAKNQEATTNNNDKNENNVLDIHASPKGEHVEISYKKKCPNVSEGHKGCIEFITSFAESREVKFPNFGKQVNALHKMLSSGVTFEQINRQIDLLEKDKFWQDRGFDLMNVANEIGKGGSYGTTS